MFHLQPTDLKNELIKIIPLQESDFDKLYAIASDELLWEQHPNKDRNKKEVFQVFFKGAMESNGAFIVYDAATNLPIGSSRYYEYDEVKKSIAIGYTFVARSYWGKGYNRALKTAMLNYAFTVVNVVVFHVGACNIRSQKAVEKLGAIKVKEIEMAYVGESNRLNFEYHLEKEYWLNINSKME